MIATQGLAIDIITLDTGRLFEQTQTLWAETERRYGLSIRAFYPEAAAVESYVVENGTNGFYHSMDARKACCRIRKVEPLRRALSHASAWITGLRADQSQNRNNAKIVENETEFGLMKFNPLINWARSEVVEHTAKNNIPTNILHSQGFPSIGCAPCTRAVKSGDSERAGRWWWEGESKKECGLHINADGRTARGTEAVLP